MNKQNRPNILFIQDDQHHAGLMSCAGHPVIKTPNIDRVVQNGVRFTNAFCPSAICQVSRVSMFTGQSAHTTGAYENAGLIRPELYSLVEHIRRNGYHTVMIGKAHFIPQWDNHGFEELHVGDFCDCKESPEENEYYVYLKKTNMSKYYDLTGEALRWSEFGAMPSRLPIEFSQEYWLADVTCDFLKRAGKSDKPFFCYASFSRPHNPWMPSAPFHSMYKPQDIILPPTHSDDWKNKPFRFRDRWHDPKLIFYYPRMTEFALRRAIALYYGLITQVDSQIGRILDYLEQTGLARSTIVVFCSDHGDFAGEHGIIDKGVPTLDGIWRVPLIISASCCGLPAGAVRTQLVNLIDVMPTLFELIGLDVPKEVEGRSLMKEIKESEWHGREAVFYEYRHVKTVRTSEYVMSYYLPGEEFARDYEHSTCWATGGELYDLRKDPNQFHNVYDEPAYLQVRLRLTEMLLEWFCNTERVHRMSVISRKANKKCTYDRFDLTPEQYKAHYMEGHPYF